jgi:lipopolysaccharide transport system ATP-binding protein
MNLHDEKAIVFQDVCKVYRLYKNQWQMALDVFGFKTKQTLEEFYALKNVNLTIKKGERIGVIGRNGAGKSTLLKLITGNFTQTTGDVSVNGKVQALMNTGVGFHPEFTGMQNIKAALLYNGLCKDEFTHAVEDIIDFVELGHFIDQPLKTYSLGMRARLYFAVATAIQPEILIVDEVLGAGDSYFSAKSADLMKKLTHSGCTLLLVSHSSAQILQFCDKAIWLECGTVVMEGPAMEVVNVYEAYAKKLELETMAKSEPGSVPKSSTIQSKWLREKLLTEVLSSHQQNHGFSTDFSNQVSRWPSQENGLKIENICLLNAQNQPVAHIKSGESLQIEISIVAEQASDYDVYFVILLFTEDGRWLSRHCSEKYQIQLAENEKYTIRMKYDETLLGNGKYIFSAAIYKTLDLNQLENARYYDLLSRSFELSVEGYHKEDSTLFYHPAVWQDVGYSSRTQVEHPLEEVHENMS